MYTIRNASLLDLDGIHACWLATDYTDAAQHAAMATLGIAPWLRHLVTTGTVSVAVADGTIIGFAGTQTRGPICYLADCFVLPAWQSRGVAKALLAMLQPPAGTTYCTLASSDPRAASRYVRQGLTPRFPVFGLRSGDRARALTPLLDVRLTEDVSAWLAYDRACIGHNRSVDIAYLYAEAPARLLQVFADGVVVGQSIVIERRYDLQPAGKYNLGPITARTPSDAAAVAQSVVAWVHQQGAREVTLRLPGPHPALPLLLDGGMQTQWVELFCANREWFDPTRYAPSGLM